MLFPLIKISNMITADLATIIERLRVEFAKPRASPRHLPFLLQNPRSSFPFLSSPLPPLAPLDSPFTGIKQGKDPGFSPRRGEDKLARRIRVGRWSMRTISPSNDGYLVRVEEKVSSSLSLSIRVFGYRIEYLRKRNLDKIESDDKTRV